MSAKHPLKELIWSLRRDGHSSREIARRLNLTDRQVRHLWRTPAQRHQEWLKKRASAIKEYRAPREVPPEVLADRDRRIEAQLTINMAVLGDPIVPRWNSNA